MRPEPAIRRPAVLGVLLLTFLVAASCDPPRPRVVSLSLVSTIPVSDSEAESVFEVVIRNPLGSAVEEVVAVASPLADAKTTIVDGESRVDEPIPAGTTVTSKDTITLVHPDDRKQSYTGADLRWEVSYRLVAPPPNRAPLAGGGFGRTVQAGDLVPLDGSRSSDPDGDPLRYAWSFASAPAGATAAIAATDAMLTSFVPDQPGLYLVQLVVDDGRLASTPWLEGITVLAVDPDPPRVISHYPDSDATLVAPNARVSAQLSEWIDPATVGPQSVSVVGVDGPVAAGSIRASGSALVFEPAAPLPAHRTFLVTLSGAIADRQGQTLGGDVSWVFSTGEEIDLDPPAIFSFTPASGASGVVATRLDAISVEFTDTIDPTSLAGRFTVSRLDGTGVPGQVQLVAGGVRARFLPTPPVGAGETWIATIAPGVLDTAGNALAQGAAWSFTTLPAHLRWLSRPGPGSPAETTSYYAGLPIRTQAFWTDPGEDPWWEPIWQGGAFAAPATFADWLWDLGWSPVGEPRAVFYDGTDLAVGRNARCFVPGTPAGPAPRGSAPWPADAGSPSAFFGQRQVACYVSNHGPIPGDPDHPRPDTALQDARLERDATSISAIFSRYAEPVTHEVLSLDYPAPYLLASHASRTVYRGDVVTIGPVTGTIWGGNPLFGANDANGIVGHGCGPYDPFGNYKCPYPEMRLYGLFVSTPQAAQLDGTPLDGARLLGTAPLTFKVLRDGEIGFAINDDDPADGSGAFAIPITVQRANAVSFQVYVPDGSGGWRLTGTAQLDDEGPKQVPQACIACHGGTWDPETQTVTGASLLPLDPARLTFPTTSGFTRAAQEEAIRQINDLVRQSQANRPTPGGPIREWIDGAYGGGVQLPGRTANDAFVPAGWANDATLYRDVAQPYCLSCHRASSPALDFDTAAELRSQTTAVRQDVCVERSMPHAGPAFEAFWRAGAAQALAQALFGGAACAP